MSIQVQTCDSRSCRIYDTHPLSRFSRLNGEDRQRWVPVIQAHQELVAGKTIYVCDLHFRPDDLIKNGRTWRPKKNVLPQLRYLTVQSY